tara:strand:- start:1529 stop:1846 length:318 start_codon:yes stop_codon:yes gene_type:complete
MGWWPFKKKRSLHSEPHIRGSKMWIQDLREVCEKSFDSREVGQLEVEAMREEWQKAFSEREVDEALLEGLERRAMLLLGAGDSEWSDLLDDEDFWKAGWGSKVHD